MRKSLMFTSMSVSNTKDKSYEFAFDVTISMIETILIH